MNFSKLIFRSLFFSMLLMFSACKTEKEEKEALADLDRAPLENNFKVIGYWPGSDNEISAEKVKELDQIIYSFLHLEGNLLVVQPEDSARLKYLNSLKKINPQLKVLISLGGWGGCETCSQVFSEQQGREDFSKSVKMILSEYEADGIDLDWEYPVIEGYPGHQFLPEDKDNFTKLVQELRMQLGDNAVISFAAGGFEDYLLKAIDWKAVMPVIDHVNLMTYDMVNGGTAHTGHHTSLYSTEKQKNSTHYAVKYLDSLGVDKAKMIIGAAFYARIWEDVSANSNGLYQPGTFKTSILYKDMEKFQQENPGFQQYWDSTAMAPYAFNKDKKLFMTYDDSLSIATKTEYAVDNGLGGIMFWQLSGDTDKGLLEIIDEVKKK